MTGKAVCGRREINPTRTIQMSKIWLHPAILWYLTKKTTRDIPDMACCFPAPFCCSPDRSVPSITFWMAEKRTCVTVGVGFWMLHKFRKFGDMYFLDTKEHARCEACHRGGSGIRFGNSRCYALQETFFTTLSTLLRGCLHDMCSGHRYVQWLRMVCMNPCVLDGRTGSGEDKIFLGPLHSLF